VYNPLYRLVLVLVLSRFLTPIPCTVNDPIANPARTPDQPQHFNQRPARSDPGRAQPAKPAVLLRSGMGEPAVAGRRRGCIYVYGRSRGHERCTPGERRTTDGGDHDAHELLFPELRGWDAVLCLCLSASRMCFRPSVSMRICLRALILDVRELLSRHRWSIKLNHNRQR
jgi:hypothetical protein